MPTPPMSDEVCREAWQAYVEHGSKSKAADALGLAYNTLWTRIQRARERGLHLSSGAQQSVSRVRLSGVEAKGGWIHDYDEEGKKVGTVRWTAPEVDNSVNMAERIAAAFENTTPAAPVLPPERVADDLLTVFPLFDVHWGMHAWGLQTGGPDYDLKTAAGDMKKSFEAILQVTPQAAEAVLILGGDFYHTDDGKEVTPQSGHSLDADGRYQKILDTSIEVMAYVVERIAARHGRLTIRVLRGNHDPHSHHVLRVGLGQRYRENPRIVVDDSPLDLFMLQWGKTAIFGHHGDRMKPVDFALKLSDVCRFWSETPHRYAYTGHLHKMGAERIGGLNWERLEPFAPSDAYGASWVNRRGLKADTYHKTSGRILTAMDPIERGEQ